MDASLTAFVTLFVVVDPIGTAPLFIALTAGLGRTERRQVAATSICVAGAVLVLFGLAGETILDFAGISMPAFRIAGGALLFLTAIDMLFERRTERRERRVAEDRTAGAPASSGTGPLPESSAGDGPAVFPLAIPLIAGPGSIAAMILLVGEAEGDVAAQAGVFAVMAAVLALTWVLFRVAEPIGRALGRTGILVVTRLMGMLLAALAVQFVIDGVAGAIAAAELAGGGAAEEASWAA